MYVFYPPRKVVLWHKASCIQIKRGYEPLLYRNVSSVNSLPAHSHYVTVDFQKMPIILLIYQKREI